MGFGTPKVIHKYDVADFMNYSYWKILFQDAGSFNINGTILTGIAGEYLDLEVTSTPTYISGGTGLYLLGSECACGPFYPPFTGTTNDNYPVGTKYYYGNIGMGHS